ncbi:MAG: FadR family transcriptional regulator [Pirellulales bacterium]|nr:FadR family transcriptional regulator [Pirellulales bacterium]
MSEPEPSSAARAIFREMLDNIQTGRWAIGSAIPSERNLIEEFGASRIAIREALSMLKGLGVLDVKHGRRTKIRTVGSEAISHLLPVMLTLGEQETLNQVFEVRLALESRTASLAAGRCTDSDIQKLRKLVERYQKLARRGESEALAVDLKFHLEIARITGNRLYVVLLEALAGFIALAQKESCKDDPARRRAAVSAHVSILRAIAARDPEWARVEMESHLRYSATRKVDDKALIREKKLKGRI